MEKFRLPRILSEVFYGREGKIQITKNSRRSVLWQGAERFRLPRILGEVFYGRERKDSDYLEY
jgi:hypothetical protein